MERNWPRFVLIMLAGAILYFDQDYELAMMLSNSPILGIGTIIFTGTALTFLLLAIRRRLPTWANSYVLVASLLSFGLYTASITQTLHYGADTPVASHYAANLFLTGRNPYTDFNMAEALQQFNLDPDTYGTKLATGAIEENFNYPAGSFLFISPFVAAGLQDTKIIYVALLAAIMLVIHYYADASLKNFVALLLLSTLAAIRFAIGGMPEPLWALPVLLGWTWRGNRWRSAIAFGAAVAVKQLAWFFAPYYIIMLMKEYGAKEAIKRGAIVAGVFAALNLPFLAQNPVAWMQGVFAPMIDPMVPMGGGIVALGITGVLPLWPKTLYTMLEGAVLIVCLVWFYRRYSDHKEAAMVLATLPLWFAWRSLLTYFYLGGILMIGVIIVERSRQTATKAQEFKPSSILVAANEYAGVQVEIDN